MFTKKKKPEAKKAAPVAVPILAPTESLEGALPSPLDLLLAPLPSYFIFMSTRAPIPRVRFEIMDPHSLADH